ncbi:hypothetical protein J3R83DRAFT_9084 [Lanmaoa asiatica]|nr:hypothetical protein J3R83DRAFT_9084 [Lanmaoa asiatica]
MSESTIRAIDAHSVHRITSGQVVIDLQTAVKELVENSLDAGATSIEVRFQNYGLKAIEVVDNGCGIAPKDYDSIALKHYTSKLSSFEDLSRVLTFGFRGEALSSLCALTDGFTVTTATSSDAPMGTIIEMDRNGKVRSKCKIARQRGTTITVSNLFKPLPVRRKEFERNTKREFQKALNLLHAYALVPCALENKGVRFTVSNQSEGGRKVIQFKTDGSPSMRTSVLAVWGSKALENIVDLDLSFDVETEKSVLRRVDPDNDISVVTPIKVQGLISKFAVGAGRSSVDRQFFFVNGRPYNPGKVQKAINEVYRTFNVNQSPFVIANVILPTNACDINVSPDKRTIFLHGETNLVQALKTALETAFSSARSTYDVTAQPSQTSVAQQNTQGQGKPHIRTRERERERERERGEKRSQRGPTSSAPDEPAEHDRTSPHPSQPDVTNGTGGGDELITMGVPHLLLEGRIGAGGESGSQSEPEPEPTLVAQPGPSGKRGKGDESGTLGEKRKGTGWMIDRPRSRAPSEPLFFPESDEEGSNTTGRVGKGKKKEVAESGQNGGVRATVLTNSATSTSTATLTHLARSSTDVPDKPRSVQTVLSTRGAAWNLRRDGDGDAEAGRERKRARLSSEGDRVRLKRKSFRSSLSQFLSSGSKALPDEEEESESDGDRDSRMQKGGGRDEEVDELDEEDEDEGEKHSQKGRKNRPRAGSDSSQVTMVVPSDDECAMDVDEPPSTATKPSRAVTSSIPQASAGDVADVEIVSEDDWAFSSTLVGTYVLPAGKTVEPSSSSRSARPLAEADTDFVTLRPASTPPVPTPSSTLRSAVSSANLETAAEDTVASAALSRIISKADFEHMVIVGQFNLGFIIVRKRSDATQGGGGGTMDDLFIVDQHAADEKWNFETLQQKTVIASQRLFRPQQLQFTAADEMLAVENMDVLKLNGFELEQVEEQETFEDDGEEGPEGVRMRLQMVAQPMSKDTVFDMKDLEELIHLMRDRPRGTMVRCSKARAMFAMRACRQSVMIGKALDKTRMTAIVRHMGTMDQPWNCPHGRPTMRHLSDLTSFVRYAPPQRAIDWAAYGMHGSILEV